MGVIVQVLQTFGHIVQISTFVLYIKYYIVYYTR